MNWSDLAGILFLVFEPEHLDTFETIEAIFTASFEEELLEVYFWEQSPFPSPWQTNWTDAGSKRGGLDINDSVFGPHRTRYTGAQSGIHCDPEDQYDCGGHNCVGTHSTVGHAAAVATTAKGVAIELIVEVHPTPTHSEVDAYN
jgi:hypothetical protein